MSNKLNTICDKNNCTGCKLCGNLCPMKCINYKMDEAGSLYPEIDTKKCISCNLCRKNCPANNKISASLPFKAYAMWSNDENIKKHSASGGIASELYRYALSHGFSTYGVVFDDEKNVKYIKIEKKEDILSVCNSKYVYSDLTSCLKELDDDLKQNKKVLFIGLACQVAAVKTKFALHKKLDNLITVDIICHGVAPQIYFSQHIQFLEKKLNKKAKEISFRNPDSLYYLSLYDQNKKLFYRKRPSQDDSYYIGYMKNLILRENCYNCKYAKRERISDLSLGDFSKENDIPNQVKEENNVSLVLVTTEKGNKILSEIISKKMVTAFEQDVTSAINNNHTLNQNTVPHPNRILFINKFKRTKNFNKAAKSALKKEIIKYRLLYFPIKIKHLLKKLFYKVYNDNI